MNDIEVLSETIELFFVKYFDNIELAGNVKHQKKENINYISIDLQNIEIGGDFEKIHSTLNKYIREWAKINISYFQDYISIAKLTIEYLFLDENKTKCKVSKQVLLYKIPPYYYHSNKENAKPFSNFMLYFVRVWHNIILRNIFIATILILILFFLSLYKNYDDTRIIDRILKAYEYINIASSIMASLALSFLINKILIIRQDKLKYTTEIINLSNKLTYFRNICYNLNRDFVFWSKLNPYIDTYNYAKSIKDDITFEEYYYPNFNDNIHSARYKSFYKTELSHNVVLLVLQLHMIADESLVDSGLTYTKFPPNYIYSETEMKKFNLFSDSNQIWYCNSELKIFPKTFDESYAQQMIIENINHIYPENNETSLKSSMLEFISLDFQYRIIPRLDKLIKVINSELPFTIKYFTTIFFLILIFGLIIPTLAYIFNENNFILASTFIIIGIISHILLSLKKILNEENSVDNNSDYL